MRLFCLHPSTLIPTLNWHMMSIQKCCLEIWLSEWQWLSDNFENKNYFTVRKEWLKNINLGNVGCHLLNVQAQIRPLSLSPYYEFSTLHFTNPTRNRKYSKNGQIKDFFLTKALIQNLFKLHTLWLSQLIPGLLVFLRWVKSSQTVWQPIL